SDFIVLNVVGNESEACYTVGEILINQGNVFNLAVGVTQAINGEVAIDRANVANSKIGDIKIDVSQFKSDSFMRDGRIRRNFLESNKYPYVNLTNAQAIGLPNRAYKDGETLHFQVVGTLEVHATQQQIPFDTTATLTGSTLVVTAKTNILMSQFGIQPPD